MAIEKPTLWKFRLTLITVCEIKPANKQKCGQLRLSNRVPLAPFGCGTLEKISQHSLKINFIKIPFVAFVESVKLALSVDRSCLPLCYVTVMLNKWYLCTAKWFLLAYLQGRDGKPLLVNVLFIMKKTIKWLCRAINRSWLCYNGEK